MAPKIICVVGPTACGKTTLGVRLAKQFNGEVVSVDSMQIYKGMTIGTAAPTEAEMDGVPHHMVAVAEPGEQWSAARYTEMAVPIIDDIIARGKLPILVGGTGLWLDALVQGRTFAGGHAEGKVRKELQQRLEQEGIEPIIAQLRQVDPAGKPSVTEFRLLERRGTVSKLALRPVTGRTHQLRVHCAYMGFPILGDPQYGNERSQEISLHMGLVSQLLCAKELRFPHPITGESLCIQSKMDV